MRNYSFEVPGSCVTQVFFSSGYYRPYSDEEMERKRARCEMKLVTALEAFSQNLTPSEEATLEQFREWFSRCRECLDWGPYRRGTGPAPRPRHECTVFVYYNINTGANLVFMPCVGYDGPVTGEGV